MVSKSKQTLEHKIEDLLAKHPHWGRLRLAKVLDVSENVIGTTCSRKGIRLMRREDLECIIDRYTEAGNPHVS